MNNTLQTTYQTQIKKLWDLAVEYGISVRSSGRDGKKAWTEFQEINKELINSIPVTFHTTPSIKSFVTKHYKWDPVDAKCELVFVKESIEHILHNNVETEHFIVQAARICHNEQHVLNPTKIAQLGYNHGQYVGEQQVKPFTYHVDCIEFYSENKLNGMQSYIL